jgi:hypothetical protein
MVLKIISILASHRRRIHARQADSEKVTAKFIREGICSFQNRLKAGCM